ncbi:MAG: DUF1326 domain-containing protein [Pirellulaceae bacterium]|nr:DUF1326 domain-containing protein [Pirellulaceae bacterium]
MMRTIIFLWGTLVLTSLHVEANEISGFYLETRTCQVYTGPCFANGESGLCGRDAIMAWSIEEGKQGDVDLAGLHVIVVVRSSDTLGFEGINGAGKVKSIILVDERANASQRQQLIDFAKKNSGRAGENVRRIDSIDIQMSLKTLELTGELLAGDVIKLRTRKAGKGDCICSNETAYYPPLAKVEHFAPGVTIEGEFKGRGLGTTWSTPGDRSAYMATFVY